MSIVPLDTQPRGSMKRVQSAQTASDMRCITQALYHLLATIIVGFLYVLVTLTKDGKYIFDTSATNANSAVAPLVVKSPLQELPWLNSVVDTLSDDDNRILSQIERRAALNIKFFAIPETVYAQEEAATRLYEYVEKQLKLAKDVATPQQAEVVLKLIESGVAQGSMMKKEMGNEGSLRNSLVIAIMKEHKGNVHFTMAGVSMEPRLGWRLITKQQRNAWNDVLTRVLDARLKKEMSMLFN